MKNGKEISYIELYDVKTNQKSRFLAKDVKSEGGFTTIPNFAVSGGGPLSVGSKIYAHL